jgi:hypothetical protein
MRVDSDLESIVDSEEDDELEARRGIKALTDMKKVLFDLHTIMYQKHPFYLRYNFVSLHGHCTHTYSYTGTHTSTHTPTPHTTHAELP